MQPIEKYGWADETRTRDLLRDSSLDNVRRDDKE